MIKNSKVKAIISLGLIWVVVGLGVFLRGFKADRYPVDNNDDGLFYVWAGNSFWDNPLKMMSHSIFEADNPALVFRSQYMDYIPRERFGMKIVRPWFDHPPLGTALIALPARWLGYRDMIQIPHLIVRLPALAASILTLFFSYLLAKEVFGKKTAWWSLIFLATVPYFVVAHRQSFLENLLTPMWLGGILSLLEWLKSKKKIWWSLLLVISFLTGWIKVTGFVVPFVLTGYLLIKKEYKAGKQLLLAGGLSILSYLAYGLIADKSVLLFTLMSQGGRGAFVSSLFDGLTRPEFYGGFNDGWYVLGFILSFVLLITKKNLKFNWFFSGWLIILWLTAGRLANSPWYRYPLIPFMGMAIGYYINKLWQKPSLFPALVFFLLGMTGFDLIGVDISANWLRVLSLVFLAPLVLSLIFRAKIWQRLSLIWVRLLIVGLVGLNIITVLRFPSVECKRHECLAPKKIVVDYE